MRHVTVTPDPYVHTYRAYNKHTGDSYGDFDCLGDAINFAFAQPLRHHRQSVFSETFKLEADQLYQNYGFDWSILSGPWTRSRVLLESYNYPPADWVITDDLGDIISKEEIGKANRSPYRNHGWEARSARFEKMERRLLIVKGTRHKVKVTYSYYEANGWRGELSLRAKVHSQFRHPKTHHERTLNTAHVEEYGWELVRGRRRRLPSSWDDRHLGIWDKMNSWKHHSKRRKQWIPK